MFNILVCDEPNEFLNELVSEKYIYSNDDCFEHPYYSIAIIRIEGTSLKCLEELKANIKLRLINAGILVKSFYTVMGTIVFLFNMKTANNLVINQILCDQISNLDLKINCGLSTSKEGTCMLHKLFKQADDALKESMFKGIRFLRYDNINTSTRSILNTGDYLKLLDHLSRGSRNEVYKQIEEIFTRLVHFAPNARSIVNTLFNVLNYLHTNLSMVYNDICDIEDVLRRLSYANNIYRLKVIVREVIDVMLDKCFNADNEDNSNHIVNYILNEIRTSYHNKIVLYELAEKLSMNYTYISGLFVKKTGMTFQQYLVNYRLDRARDLLLGSKNQLNEISLKCGFYDSKYLSKAFRKRFNMTPLEYRNHM